MNDAPAEIEFLTVEVVVALHRRQLERFGGGTGLRDLGLLESAVAQPQASFGGEFVHDGLFAMAAAYLFHIVSRRPDPARRSLPVLRDGADASPLAPPHGCAYFARCPNAERGRCDVEVPPLKETAERSRHRVACWHPFND